MGRTCVTLTQPRNSKTCRFGVEGSISGIDAFERSTQLFRLNRSILGPRCVAMDQIPRSETAHPAKPRVSTSVSLRSQCLCGRMEYYLAIASIPSQVIRSPPLTRPTLRYSRFGHPSAIAMRPLSVTNSQARKSRISKLGQFLAIHSNVLSSTLEHPGSAILHNDREQSKSSVGSKSGHTCNSSHSKFGCWPNLRNSASVAARTLWRTRVLRCGE